MLPQPEFVTAQLLVNVVTIAVVIHVILGTVAYLIYLERKISAYIQDRIGPNRVGPLGLLQPIADGLKFILKEDYAPTNVDKVMFTLAPMLSIIPAMIGFIVIPWGGTFLMPDITLPILKWHIEGGLVQVTGATVGVGIVYLLSVASLGVYGITLGGWASNNKYSFLGGLRATAQMLAYEIPLGLSVLCVVLVVGSVMPNEIIRQQVDGGWFVIAQPLTAILFFIAILAEANRAPFDNAEAEQELVGGYHTEYSAMRFAMFFLAEYSHIVTSCAFFTLLFLGGYHLPFIPQLDPASTGLLAVLMKFGVYFTKVLLLICFVMVIRWTIPRFRYDQVMVLGWQGLIPIAMVHFVLTFVFAYLNMTSMLPLLLLNVGMMALVVFVQGWLPKQTTNRKVQLYGSRYSSVPGTVVVTAPTDPTAIEDHPVRGLAPSA
ncbi:MAG: NADH-quinone oxidoreductase subunit NuoH [Phycisphaeraceae bacterium]|nr:NADH-quinone oxidoreductase subunit NuoH [Phycisphaerales bacterium]MCB9861218.1 NADH-quinone oxidoreductase subunit NuoH [Phycisphaeraceae bacterium]